ncbi:MAG: glycosyltransferase family protein [Methanothrix sp.]|nr:glycosyltransferase family protein [Methanothrix sp.]
MISVICVYNNKAILDSYLLKGINGQTASYELILLDNTSGIFKSAAGALNQGGSSAKGDYLMFVHQDVLLSSKDWLGTVASRLDRLPKLGIAGVAGARGPGRCVVTNLMQGDPPVSAGHVQIDRPEAVQTLDESLVLIPREVFRKLKFDEVICDDWHLYAVEYCLSARKLGYNVYVIPDGAYHHSPGTSLSWKYYRILGKLLNKHRDVYPVIFTTCGNWKTSYPKIVYVLIWLRYTIKARYARVI